MKTSMHQSNKPISGGLFLMVLSLLLGSAVPGSSAAPSAAGHTFPETGHTVDGTFWSYWQQHGGLAQQGYPISEELQEVSDLNGQTYTVQYFERAVFEKHPENQPPYDVLLSQLGTFRYKAKYGDVGAPDQQVSTNSPRFFPETKHTVGGKFRAYWETHGALAQQGYPISDEFTEVSDLNNKPYTVQYFERAVFELHPENQSPYDVLLSQLGTYRLNAHNAPTPTATAEAQETATPVSDGFAHPEGIDPNKMKGIKLEGLHWHPIDGVDSVTRVYNDTMTILRQQVPDLDTRINNGQPIDFDVAMATGKLDTTRGPGTWSKLGAQRQTWIPAAGIIIGQVDANGKIDGSVVPPGAMIHLGATDGWFGLFTDPQGQLVYAMSSYLNPNNASLSMYVDDLFVLLGPGLRQDPNMDVIGSVIRLDKNNSAPIDRTPYIGSPGHADAIIFQP
ncbi:MAG: hypothetical protein ACR2M0_10975 [Chloroflexia bacterium]